MFLVDETLVTRGGFRTPRAEDGGVGHAFPHKNDHFRGGRFSPRGDPSGLSARPSSTNMTTPGGPLPPRFPFPDDGMVHSFHIPETPDGGGRGATPTTAEQGGRSATPTAAARGATPTGAGALHFRELMKRKVFLRLCSELLRFLSLLNHHDWGWGGQDDLGPPIPRIVLFLGSFGSGNMKELAVGVVFGTSRRKLGVRRVAVYTVKIGDEVFSVRDRQMFEI